MSPNPSVAQCAYASEAQDDKYNEQMKRTIVANYHEHSLCIRAFVVLFSFGLYVKRVGFMLLTA